MIPIIREFIQISYLFIDASSKEEVEKARFEERKKTKREENSETIITSRRDVDFAEPCLFVLLFFICRERIY